MQKTQKTQHKKKPEKMNGAEEEGVARRLVQRAAPATEEAGRARGARHVAACERSR